MGHYLPDNRADGNINLIYQANAIREAGGHDQSSIDSVGDFSLLFIGVFLVDVDIDGCSL